LIEVRLAHAGEAEAIAQLHVASRRAAYAGIFAETQTTAQILANRRAQWERAIPLGKVWVAEREGELCGVARAGATRDADVPPATAELYLLYVALGSWRSGVGSALLAHLEAHLHAQGHRDLTVWVLTENAIGCAFYSRRGFIDDGTARDVNGRGLIEKRMTKPLSLLASLAGPEVAVNYG
jgi:L-amino acid N-acyltransferase YncA